MGSWDGGITWLETTEPKTLCTGLCAEFDGRFPGCRKFLYLKPAWRDDLWGSTLMKLSLWGLFRWCLEGLGGRHVSVQLGLVSPVAGDCRRPTGEYFGGSERRRRRGTPG